MSAVKPPSVVRVMVMSWSMAGEKCSDKSREIACDVSGMAPASLSSATGTVTGLRLTITTVVFGLGSPAPRRMAAPRNR